MNQPTAARAGRTPWVWMYHSIDHVDADPYLVTVSPPRFERQLAWLKAHGLRGVSMPELLTAMDEGRARDLVGLTFDDGYADFADTAVPALLRYGFTATVFVVSARIGSYNAWDEGPRKPLMTAEQLRSVDRAGMQVSAHGRYHLSLPSLDDDELGAEVEGCRTELEDVLGRAVTGFAYPYGHVTDRETRAVRAAGYDHACAVRPQQPGRHALARTYVGERDRGMRLHAKWFRHGLYQRSRS
jgi:peptidoglycan/xylan/chitin deacetylase (PgdA/CDA1 family)